MKTKYFMELYFFKDKTSKTELDKQPNLEHYKPETIMTTVIATSWEEAKRNILLQYHDIAYIHIHETSTIDI